MSGTYFRQPAVHSKPGFTFISCRSFTKDKKWIQKFKIREDSRYNYQKELNKDCFEHEKDMGYFDIKDLSIRITSHNAFHDQTFNNAKIRKYDGYQSGLASVFYNFFYKKSLGGEK